MRSLKLCLLVFLTSCMLDTINATTEFCKTPAPSVPDDCEDKHDAKDEFAWTVATSFDNRKLVPEGEFVEIDMHRALYVEGQSVNIDDVKFESNNFDNCQIYFLRKDGKFNSKKITVSTSVPFQSPTFEVNEKIVLAVTDPNCRMYAKITDKMKKGNLYHIFLRNLKTERVPESAVTIAGNAVETKKLFRKHGHLIYSQKQGINEGNVAIATVGRNKFFRHPDCTASLKPCYHVCKHGSLFVYTVVPGGGTFANKFKMSKKCEWMSIHIDASQKEYSAEISLRHGFAKLPNELKVYPMDFESIDGSGYEVTVMYVAEQILDSAGKATGTHRKRMVITNSHGRAIRSYEIIGNTKDIHFAFSHDECLTANIGSEFEGDHKSRPPTKYKPKGFEFASIMNIAHKVNVEPQLNVRTCRTNPMLTDPTDYSQYESLTSDNYVTTGYTLKDDENMIVATKPPPTQTTKAQVTVNVDDTAAPLPANTPQQPTEEDLKHIADFNAATKAYEELKKRIEGGVYYCYWGIPGGFAAGSFGTFIICNIILFFFKRSVLTFWYKAMYKRYGSDTTMGAGTTMGKTVGGETIGGGTTMGGTTAGGETTVGSTTAA